MAGNWEVCPKCKGVGEFFPFGIYYFRETCNVCKGHGIINSQTGLPHKK